MYDRETVLGCLRDIHHALVTVGTRSKAIKQPEDLVANEAGQEKLDAICMQLIAVGEALKQIDKITRGSLLPKNRGVEWDKAMKMRDFIAHHYFDIDYEVVFLVCKTHVPIMAKTIRELIAEMEKA